MHATIQCTCGKHLDADAQRPGDRAQCPACGNVFVIGEPANATGIRTEAPPTKATPATPIITALHEPRSIEKPSERSRIGTMVVAVILMIPIAMCIVGYSCTGQLGGGKRDEALTQVRGTLSNCCESFKRMNGRWPESLEEMLLKNQNGGPYLESRDALKDPWGNVYRYDVKGPMNKGMRPDIWTESMNPGEKIGNWQAR